MTIKLGYLPYVIRKLVEGIYLQEKRLKKSCESIFIGPLFLQTAWTFAKPVLDAKN